VLGRLFGASRFVWNWGLARRTSAYQADQTRLNWISLSREFTAVRQAPETHWLCELPREPFNQVLRDQERAFQNFLARRARHPRTWTPPLCQAVSVFWRTGKDCTRTSGLLV
jgi:putative transposase